MSKKSVLIAGSGPSAALAVLAASDAGAEYTVVSATDPSQRPPGAFFLHWLPPSLRALPVEVEIQSVGTAQMYCWKQWGCGYESSFPKSHVVRNWYPAECLAQVWTSTKVMLEEMCLEDLIWAAKEYDWVFYTWALGDNMARRIPVHLAYQATGDRPVILYNGTKEDQWCRRTWAFGEVHTEYPHGFPAPAAETDGWMLVPDLPPWTKPVEKRIAPNLVPIGRLAKQDSRYLAHQAYEEVYRCLEQ